MILQEESHKIGLLSIQIDKYETISGWHLKWPWFKYFQSIIFFKELFCLIILFLVFYVFLTPPALSGVPLVWFHVCPLTKLIKETEKVFYKHATLPREVNKKIAENWKFVKYFENPVWVPLWANLFVDGLIITLRIWSSRRYQFRQLAVFIIKVFIRSFQVYTK